MHIKPGHAMPRFISAEITQKTNANTIEQQNNRGVYEVLRQGNGIINYLPISITETSFKAWCAGGVIADVDESFSNALTGLNPEIKVSSLKGTLHPTFFELKNNDKINTNKQTYWNYELSGASHLKRTLGLTGHGRKIGIIALDYGFSHKCLDDRIKSVMKFNDIPSEASDTRSLKDLYLVHPLGLLVGSDSSNLFKGIAPEAEIRLALISKDANNAEELLKAIQWTIAPEQTNCPDAILFLADFRTPPPLAIQKVLNACRNIGIIPIAPSGNNPNSISGIAALPCTVTIGAIDRWQNKALFSGTGPVKYMGQKIIKPDFCEPGLAIFGPANKDQYTFGSGTSQAAVHFAGIYLLLKQMFPNEDPELILTRMRQTAIDLDDIGPDYNVGNGLPDTERVINLLMYPPSSQYK